ncbi:MAG: type II toxin-antitoxin system RelE/ParE family toxin [Sulfuricurvum sp.]|jgi:mRNA interferase RelE/StbE|uniref:type II toxin-antitoxin system RelE family toxin n=1 Tax=Sulfuricurvum sp. TaxID=2025608 RepID=UPI0025F467A8|nr:type II toxin-antitoxin system RelE/ParE family toxin [Sulfuricurvum sp.]MCI4405684.1 type II toxin-antitoxin system RelE/ParE family toxin [Sulfuricurvum sp.]
MSAYSLEFHPAAKKELDKLDHQVKVFIVQSLSLFIENYDIAYEAELMKLTKVKKLQGQWDGFYRLRLRDYRVIYEKINDRLVIHIIRIAHRKEVY